MRIHLDQIDRIGRPVEVRDRQFQRKYGARGASRNLAVTGSDAVKKPTRGATVHAVAACLVRPGGRPGPLDEDTAIVSGLAAIITPVRLNPLHLYKPHRPPGGGVTRRTQQSHLSGGSNRSP